jgi:hypothetical protein
MARPKSATTPAQIQAEIARARRDADAQVKQLEARLREAQARENHRRGELVSQYLAGPKGGELRRALHALVSIRKLSLIRSYSIIAFLKRKRLIYTRQRRSLT